MGKTHFLEEIKAIKACIQVDGTVGTRSRFTPTACAVTTTSNEIERKTPFFMWKEIFERFFTAEFLAELAAKSASYQVRTRNARTHDAARTATHAHMHGTTLSPHRRARGTPPPERDPTVG